MGEIKIINNREQAVAIIKATAEWCGRKGLDVPRSWRSADAMAERIAKSGFKDDEYFVFTMDGKSIGACVLSDRDMDNEWKKYGYGDRHYYFGKFCVKDEFHGTGISRVLLDALKEKAIADGVKSIRCVAVKKIAPIYIDAGFFPHWPFYGKRAGKTFVRLAWYRWTPDEFETIWRGAGKFNLRRRAYLTLKRILWFL